MPDFEIEGSLRNIGIILVIIGGVLAAMESIESIFAVLTLLILPPPLDVPPAALLPLVLSGITGLVAGGLSVAIIWLALLSLRSPERKFGWRIVACSAGAIGMGLVFLIVTGLIQALEFETEVELVVLNLFNRTASRALGDIFEFSAVSLVGGALIILGTPKQTHSASEQEDV